MSEFTLYSVTDAGDDLLVVLAHDGDGNPLYATGWVSATTNYFPPSDYDADGNLVEGAQPRAMSPEEIGAYARALIVEQNPQVQPAPPAPTPLTFT